MDTCPTLLLAALLTLGCAPDFPMRPSAVAGARVLAVQMEPAELPPGGVGRFSVLAVDPSGTLAAPRIAWSFCRAPRPVSSNTPVSPDCIVAATAAPSAAIAGSVLSAALPEGGCRVHGPEQAPGSERRAPEPDPSGGYYQPLGVALDTELAFGFARLRCALADAPVRVAQDFDARYQPNQNPALDSLILRDASGAQTTRAAPGAKLTIEARWPSAARERYLRYDRRSGGLIEVEERLTLSWFVTGGALDADQQRIEASSNADGVRPNGWTAPTEAAAVHLWVVLRDDRGGITWDSMVVQVTAP
ncbi:MAG: hypothetical protein ACPGUV_00850 [Polyangiales bacterium]